MKIDFDGSISLNGNELLGEKGLLAELFDFLPKPFLGNFLDVFYDMLDLAELLDKWNGCPFSNARNTRYVV